MINFFFSSNKTERNEDDHYTNEKQLFLKGKIFKEEQYLKFKNKNLLNKGKASKKNKLNNYNINKENAIIKTFEFQILSNKNKKEINMKNKRNLKENDKNPLYIIQNEKKDNFLKMIDEYKITDIGDFIFFKDFLIGEGSFKHVYFGFEKITHNPCAVLRLKEEKNGENIFEEDFKKLKYLENLNFFQKALCYFESSDDIYIITSLKGPNLDKLITFSNKNCEISKNCAYRIGIELLYNLKLLHKNGILHLDIKGDNIILQDKPKIIDSETIHFCLTDFGNSFQFKNAHGKIFSRKKPNRCGNYCYASMNSLNYEKVGKKDDIISASLFVFDLCIGYKLPWEDFSFSNNSELRNAEIESKKSFDINQFYKGEFTEIKKIYEEANALQLNEEPNYNKYISILKKAMQKDNKGKNNRIYFDWEKKIIEKAKLYKINKKI